MPISVKGPGELAKAVVELVKAGFPGATDKEIQIELLPKPKGLQARCFSNGEEIYSYWVDGGKLELKQLARLATVRSLKALNPEVELPWGILTGIRPTKIVHRLIDQGLTLSQIRETLDREYLIAREKIDLVMDVACLQRPYLLNAHKARQLVSVYIGIPFCPSRCSYCSFPSFVGSGSELDQYLRVLRQEVAALGRALRDRKLEVQTLYLGGGTPTILNASQLSGLLERCFLDLASPKTIEVTVEAGRPETLDKEKLSLMARAGVNRISINPQTMVEQTLTGIGRKHSPLQVVEAYTLAREYGFKNINMDIILGLPGEGPAEVAYTLAQIADLGPDSLTIHALALKRASSLKEDPESQSRLPRAKGKEMQLRAAETVRMMGMQPYYLYRQKQILDNLENVGYAKPGKESVYNIQVMEERQTIFGLGAGAASKIVNPGDWTLTNYQNPKHLESYALHWQGNLEQKLGALDRCNGGLN